MVGDRLIIQYSKPRWGFGFHAPQPAKHLTVEIPRTLAGQLVELQVDTVSAPVTATGLTAQDCEVDSVSGNVTFTGCSFESWKWTPSLAASSCLGRQTAWNSTAYPAAWT
ncbi:MAG: hypothetical protein ACLSHU_03545 [Oscillospiraceae bacterium]